MNGSINTASESSNSVQAHMNIIGDCINQIGQALTLSRESVKAYASKAMSGFGGGSHSDDFLFVDQVTIMIKKLTHHLREMLRDLQSGGKHTQNRELIATMNEHIALLETAQHRSSFLQRTFGWALQEPMAMMKNISNEYAL